MRIILIGFMGAGKSTVGALLSTKLGLQLIELDDLIATRSGYPTVAALVDAEGEGRFRDIETAVAREANNADNVVISTGGGIIGRQSNRDALVTTHTKVVYLRTTFESVQMRLGEAHERPLFRDKEKSRALFEDRQAIYELWASLIVDTDGFSPTYVTNVICKKLEAFKSK